MSLEQSGEQGKEHLEMELERYPGSVHASLMGRGGQFRLDSQWQEMPFLCPSWTEERCVRTFNSKGSLDAMGAAGVCWGQEWKCGVVQVSGVVQVGRW